MFSLKVSEINLYLEETKQTKSHKIPQKVFDLHKETTNSAKDVSQQLKQLAIGSDLKEMVIKNLWQLSQKLDPF